MPTSVDSRLGSLTDPAGQDQSRICAGCWITETNALIHSAAAEPSTARWSTDRVTSRTEPTASLSFFTTGARCTAPTARIEACGGVVTAGKLSLAQMVQA